MPEIRALRYGSHIGESASWMNLRKASRCRKIPKRRGVRILVLIHFSAISIIYENMGSK